MNPNFLILGGMRCGSTFLSSSLARHPQIFVSRPKELNFFNLDSNYSRGLGWYSSHFDAAGDALAVGEATTRYSKVTEFPLTARRIAQHLPAAKLIYIVRHPLDRIESNWKHYLRWGDSQLDFNSALEAHPEWVDTSCYWRQISAYREHFPDEQILVLFFEELRHDPGATLRQCYEFLDVDASLPLDESAAYTNESAGRVVEGRLLRRLRRVSALQAFARSAPSWSKRVARRALSYEVPAAAPLWSDELRESTLAKVASDAASFLEFYRRPAHLWTFGGSSE